MLYIEVYDLTTGESTPVAKTYTTLCAAHYNSYLGSSGLELVGSLTGSGAATDVSLICTNLVAGHSYKIVAALYCWVAAYGGDTTPWTCPAHATVSVPSSILESIVLRY